MSPEQDLLTAAILGTDQQAIPAWSTLGLPADSQGDRSKSDGEKRAYQILLNAAAMLEQMKKSGAKLSPFAGEFPAESEEEEREAVPDKAASILRQLLYLRQDMLNEWLQIACQHRMRIPHDCLVPLLRLAQRDEPLKELLSCCASNRAFWLADLNPEWNFFSSKKSCETDDLKKKFELGQKQERTAALLQLRRSDPEAALQLLSKDWAKETAEDRASFIACLDEGLDQKDEPFLENALSDRRKEVRISAGELLLRLPGSRLSRRAKERAFACFQKSAAGDRLFVKVPQLCDAEMQKDGIIAAAPTQRGMGERGYWLAQLISRCDPALLLEHLQMSAGEFLAAIRLSEWQAALKSGLAEAAERWKSAEPARLLLLEESWERAEQLFDILNESDKELVLGQIIEARRFLLVKQVGAFYDSKPLDLLMRTRQQWSTGFSSILLRTVRTHMAQGNHSIFTERAMRHIGNHLNLSLWESVQESWQSTAQYNSAMSLMLSTLSLRAEIRESFSTSRP